MVRPGGGASPDPGDPGELCGRCPESGGKDCEELCDCMETHEMPVDEEVLNRGQSTPPFPLPFAPEFTTLEDGVLHWEGEESGVMISTSPEVMGEEMSKDESEEDLTMASVNGARRRSGRRKGKEKTNVAVREALKKRGLLREAPPKKMLIRYGQCPYGG